MREALLAKATYLCRIGDKEAALTAFRVAGEKTVSLSQRLDIAFTLIRLGFFFDDNELISKSIEKARFQLEEGGDWDRKNRLKVRFTCRAVFSSSQCVWSCRCTRGFI